MRISNVIQGRQSIRAYRPDPVDMDQLRDLVLQVAIWAPSTGNAQILMNINKDQQYKQVYQQLLELICYTAISARNLVEQPKLYRLLRMIDVVGRLLDILSCKDIKFPLSPVFHKHIKNTKNNLIEGEASFVANLDSLVADAISVLTNSQKEDNQ